MGMMRVWIWVLALGVAASAVAAPAGLELAADQVFRRANGSEPQSLDPHKSEGVPASNIQRDLFEGLISEAPDGTLVPGVALSWEVERDGLLYRFHLRPEARWSNGDPVTAQDFVYAWRRILDPLTGSYYSQTLAPILNAEAIIRGEMPKEKLGVRALDDHTLEVDLRGPTPYFLGLLTHSSTYPVHRATVEKYGEQWARPGRLVGNGAFILQDWVVQSHIELRRNPYYWDDAHTTLDRVLYYPIEDASTALKRYRAGELDVTETFPITQLPWLRKHIPDEIRITPYLGTYYYGFNLTRPPFRDNRKLRQALTMTVDREILTDKVLRSGEIPAYGWVPPGVQNYEPVEYEWKALSKQQRLEVARRLYREAGYSRGNPLTVEIRYNTSENHKKIAVAIGAMWKKALGVRVRLVNEEWKVFLENRKQKQVTQIFRAGWIADYNDAYSFAELLHSRHGINDSGYDNPEYDALLEASAREPDPEKRKRLLQQAERIMLDDYPILPIYFYVSKHVIKPWVGGWVDNIMDHHYSKHIYIEKH